MTLRGLVLLLPLLGFVNLSCGGRPSVEVRISATAPIEDLDRVRLVIRRCDKLDLAIGEDIAEPKAGIQPAGVGGTADIPAGVPFYVWVQGWEACSDTAPCIPEEGARPGDCICFENGQKQRLTREGCTDWLTLEAGELRQVGVTLGPSAGLCPPTTSTCG